MIDTLLLWDWLELAIRWVHVITAIAWIGSSFYFIALDLGLTKHAGLPPGATGEEWQVHGGGFYHIQKYAVAPENMPEHLTWFKWESYSTWLSGAALMAVMYWAGAELYLIDYDKIEWPVWAAIALSAGSIALGWIVYDFLCKSRLGHRPTLMMLALFAIIVVMSWALNQIFTGRAALLHLGAFTATIMSANVFFIIIPNQKIVVADLKAGRTPDPEYGRIAKLRSTHNNYLTLPVIFLMLSTHYPLAFGTEFAWVIAALVFLMGVSIRHFFNTMHARKGSPWYRWPWWTWAPTAAVFAALIALSTATTWDYPEDEAYTFVPERLQPAVAADGFDEVRDVVLGRCAMCHAGVPAWPGIAVPPKGVMLETDAQIAAAAKDIFLQAGVSHAMPPGNITYMEPAERAAIVAWFRSLSAPDAPSGAPVAREEAALRP
ncbi:MAG: urate hydroxylase PuuD [Pseudomonadota bacterium]